MLIHCVDESAWSDPATPRPAELLVSDGPFAETKEQVGGYDVIDCSDLDEAIEIASKHPTAWYGTIEVRPIAGEHCQDFE
jgi:hypothetical protein